MAITNGNYVTSPVPNTTLLEKLRDGVLYCYVIAPIEGYLLHDKDLDIYDYDDEGNQTELIETWFTGSTTTVRLDYDFTIATQGEYKYTDEITMPVTIIGAREFYTVPSNAVPSDHILG